MGTLVRYEAARAALQAAHDVDEVKEIRDKAQAMALYAQQAKDTDLMQWASEIKVRAERRAGEMLAEVKRIGHRKGGDKDGSGIRSTLERIEVPLVTAHRWQRLAAVPEDKFDRTVAEAKKDGRIVTTAEVLRAAKPKKKQEPTPKPKPEKREDKDTAKLRAELIDVRGKFSALAERHADLADTARELEDKLTRFETTDPDEQQKLIEKLQKKILRLEAEIERLTRARNDAQAKNNELIREIKRLRRA